MPGNCPPRSIVYVLVFLQLQLLTIHCAPRAVESFEANQPPLIFPGEAPVRLQPPPMLFPTDAVSKIVHVDVAPPPSVFPTNRADVIRAGDQSTSAKEPPVIFPTDRSLYNIVEPTGESVNVTLANLKNRTLSLLNAAKNPKDDAIRLEDNSNTVLEENPLQPEEQYGSHNNNLMAVNSIALDDTLIVDRPHETTSRTLLFSVFLTVSVLAACMMISLLVWRKYVQQKYGMRERLLTEEEGFNAVIP